MKKKLNFEIFKENKGSILNTDLEVSAENETEVAASASTSTALVSVTAGIIGKNEKKTEIEKSMEMDEVEDEDEDEVEDENEGKDAHEHDVKDTISSNLSICVNEEHSNIRIDVFLNKTIEQMTRSQIQKLIEENNVLVNDKIIKSNYKTKTADRIQVFIPLPRKLEVQAEDIKLDIIYEDEDLVVVNKPQGMVVHPAAGNYTGTLVNALLGCCGNLSGINGVIRPGIVHRIDKDTSGVLVVAKNDMAHKNLAAQIKEHTVNRIYIALVEGIIKQDAGTIDQPLGRHPQERKKIAVIKNGRNAVTHYNVIERYKNYTLVEAKLETGRTHQIRVHMAFIGHPLVGDPAYGNKKQKFNLKGQMLHAKTLGFIHPRTNEYMEFTAPVPLYFEKLLQTLKNGKVQIT